MGKRSPNGTSRSIIFKLNKARDGSVQRHRSIEVQQPATERRVRVRGRERERVRERERNGESERERERERE